MSQFLQLHAKYSLGLLVLAYALHIRTNHKSYSNIAAVGAQHSDCGLFPDQSQRLLLAVSQKDLANSREPILLFRNPHQAFKDEVVDSNLLSRGWVYQEILLAPANLYCTYAQMWWSCAHASRSETFPIYDNRQQRFIDKIQEKKHAMMGRIGRSEPTKSWMSVLHGYTPTTLTFYMMTA